jgi:hypothetical protein
MFENGGRPLRLHPDFAEGQRTRETGSCARLLTRPAEAATPRCHLWAPASWWWNGTVRCTTISIARFWLPAGRRAEGTGPDGHARGIPVGLQPACRPRLP